MQSIRQITIVLFASLAISNAISQEAGFTSLFNGKDLSGWTGDTKRYKVQDGTIVCGGRNLFTEKEYANFVFRFEFKLPKAGNNGLAIRAPLKGNAAYAGMELQILDNSAPKYAKLRPVQYHGSIYDVVAAKRGHLKPVGEWNVQEVTASGSKIKVVLNGTTILDVDINELKKALPEKTIKRHPGLFRAKGHIGFLGHGAPIAFRNIRIKELEATEAAADDAADDAANAEQQNVPPKGFTALFNGKDLTNWRGLMKRPYDNPHKRAGLSDEERKKRQAEADAHMQKHWSVADGILIFDGKGHSLATSKQYTNFEMYVDWKIAKGGDSGVYLRGTPQVQIWDRPKVGSGGLYNNKKNPSKPLVVADNPPGKWNTFHIKMVGDKVTIHLNKKLIVDNITLENYWNRKLPVLSKEQIELQCHGHRIEFRNIFIKELE